MADPLHILLVDADAARREAVAAALRALGMGIDACTTPVEAMGHLVRRTPPEVTGLLVAGDLPGMGPVLLIRAARTVPGRADLPVVVLGAGGAELGALAHCRIIDHATVEAAPCILASFAVPDVAPPCATARVLVVDDHEVNRLILVKTIEARGIPVDTAVDGIDALAKAGRQRYALVFMDVEMPRMDGLEATRAIRRLEQDKSWRTPIVACTSRNQPGDRATGLAAGMDDYLVKPVSPEIIDAQIDRWLARRSPSATVPAVTLPSAPAVVEPPFLDRAVLDRIKGYGQEVLANTAGRFLEELDERVATLERLAAAGTCEDLYRQAHGLKGVSGSLGLKRLWQAMAGIEAAGRAGDIVKARTLMAELPPVIAGSRQALQEGMRSP